VPCPSTRLLCPLKPATGPTTTPRPDRRRGRASLIPRANRSCSEQESRGLEEESTPRDPLQGARRSPAEAPPRPPPGGLFRSGTFLQIYIIKTIWSPFSRQARNWPRESKKGTLGVGKARGNASDGKWGVFADGGKQESQDTPNPSERELTLYISFIVFLGRSGRSPLRGGQRSSLQLCASPMTAGGVGP